MTSEQIDDLFKVLDFHKARILESYKEIYSLIDISLVAIKNSQDKHVVDKFIKKIDCTRNEMIEQNLKFKNRMKEAG